MTLSADGLSGPGSHGLPGTSLWLGARLEPVEAGAAWLAGRTFKRYREGGGPRRHLIPDFLIAAHAQLQADRLAAEDRGYLRTYFPDLELLRPPSRL